MRKKNYSTASNEHGCTKPYKFNVEVADGSTSSTSSLIVFQLLIRCVHLSRNSHYIITSTTLI